MTIIGLDIGGANLKAATTARDARSRPFALWKNPNGLASELVALIRDWEPADQLAVTMTGELCDCFADRAEGVRHIVHAVAEVSGPTPVFIWRTDGRFATPAETLEEPLSAASANWLALATFAGRFAPTGAAILLDIGSTTTDIVPLMDGQPIPRGRRDHERLQCGELLYTGARRTPVCGLLDPGEGMAEFFATMHDVYLVLGEVSENSSDCDTADGRPATQHFAHARLARMLGCDSLPSEEIARFAESLARRQQSLIAAAVDRLNTPDATIILAGSGRHLAHRREPVIDLHDRLGPQSSTAACAVAVATLLHEQQDIFRRDPSLRGEHFCSPLSRVAAATGRGDGGEG
jgi:(4-(4-[2-(gamma-L-glutamylamino)ethyl]phenoxymethyl)furan-2-yl)methanamine synthase